MQATRWVRWAVLVMSCASTLACTTKSEDDPASSAGSGSSAAGTGASGTNGSAGMNAAGATSSAGTTASGAGTSGALGGSGGAAGSIEGDSGLSPGDSGMGTGDDGGAPTTQQDLAPIDPPVAAGCIDDVSAGDHTYNCDGIPFLTMVDEQCTTNACGLIIDVHGATMTGEVMRMNNRLHELAPPKGYIAVAPTEPGGAWDYPNQMPVIADFIEQMIAVFQLNTRRIHITGFSMGSGATFWFLCNRPDLIASGGPVTGASANQVVVEDTGTPCIAALDQDWQPRVPILFMSGTSDTALTIEAARERTDNIVAQLGLTGGDEIDGDDTYRRKRWTGSGGMVFDFLEHDYSGAVGGHCIPGPTPDLIYGCTSGDVTLDWGETILQFFVEHPKP